MASKRAHLKGRLLSGGIRFSKFSVVGVANAVVDFAVLNLLLWLYPTGDPWQIVLYNLAALVAANLNSYVGNSFWTFRGSAERSRRETVLFVLQAGLNVAVSTGVFWLFVKIVLSYTDLPLYLGENIAKAISVVIASTMSFFIMRYLVFPETAEKGGKDL